MCDGRLGTYRASGECREQLVMGHTFHLKKFLARKGTALPLFPRYPFVGNMRPSGEVSTSSPCEAWPGFDFHRFSPRIPP
jgi:hypothetical protein